MEQLSFASVYRTAAILAAFSHASAAGEDLDGCSAWPPEIERSLDAADTVRPGHSFFDACLDYLRRCRIARAARPYATDAARPGGWEPKGLADTWTSMGPHRPCVTSHFAFAEEADRFGSGS